MFGLFKNNKLSYTEKELERFFDKLIVEQDKLKQEHKKQINSLRADYESKIFRLRLEINELEKKEPKTIIKYVKR